MLHQWTQKERLLLFEYYNPVNWLQKTSRSDRLRLEENIERLHSLHSAVHDLGFFTVASQSGGYQALQEMLENNLVKGRPAVYEKLKSALIGENNQKLILDAPTKAQRILIEAEDLISREIIKEERELKQLLREID